MRSRLPCSSSNCSIPVLEKSSGTYHVDIKCSTSGSGINEEGNACKFEAVISSCKFAKTFILRVPTTVVLVNICSKELVNSLITHSTFVTVYVKTHHMGYTRILCNARFWYFRSVFVKLHIFISRNHFSTCYRQAKRKLLRQKKPSLTSVSIYLVSAARSPLLWALIRIRATSIFAYLQNKDVHSVQ